MTGEGNHYDLFSKAAVEQVGSPELRQSLLEELAAMQAEISAMDRAAVPSFLFKSIGTTAGLFVDYSGVGHGLGVCLGMLGGSLLDDYIEAAHDKTVEAVMRPRQENFSARVWGAYTDNQRQVILDTKKSGKK